MLGFGEGERSQIYTSRGLPYYTCYSKGSHQMEVAQVCRKAYSTTRNHEAYAAAAAGAAGAAAGAAATAAAAAIRAT